MHEKVEAYINAKKEEKKAAFLKEKEETLIKLGLYEKVYAPEGLYDTYPFTEWDSEEKRYYKKKAIDVTYEEYEEILKYSDVSWGIAFVNGSTYLSIAEMLKILDDIKNKKHS